jgi:RHS repeat-associated protein
VNLLDRLRRLHALSYLTLVTLVATLVPRTARADAPDLPDGLTPEVQAGKISVGPQASAGGADEGPLAAANVDPATGTLHVSIPFKLPEARGTAQPSLGLNYSSNGGWGIAGLGWSLDLPSIERHNPSGTPNYANDPPVASPSQSAPINPATQDRFTFQGKPLIPVCSPSSVPGCLQGNPSPESLPSWVVDKDWTYYRLETDDGSNLRFFWFSQTSNWVVQYPSGTTMEFGLTTDLSGIGVDALDGRDVDPVATVALGRPAVFRWHLVRQYDAQRLNADRSSDGSSAPGNFVNYAWSKLTIPGTTEPTLLSYLVDIFYTPPPGTATPATAFYENHVHLSYVPGPTVSVQNLSPVSRARPGFLLSGVDVTAQTSPPVASGAREQIRRYILKYQSTGMRELQSVQMEGWCGANNPTLEDTATQLLPAEPTTGTNCPSLPPTQFTFSAPQNTTFTLLPVTDFPGLSYPEFQDFNLDGLPDLVVDPNLVSEEVYLAPSFSAALPVAGLRSPWEGRPLSEQYNAGSFGDTTQAPGVMWMQGFDPSDVQATANTVTTRSETNYTPSMAGGNPQWTANAALAGTLVWSATHETNVDFSYLKKYSNVDFDGDGFPDMIASMNGFEPATDGNAPPAEYALSVLFTRLVPPEFVTSAPYTFIPKGLDPTDKDAGPSFGSPEGTYAVSDLLNGASNACIAGLTNGGVVFGGPPCGGGDDDNPNPSPVSQPNTMADMNGDGIPDWVFLTCSTLSVAYGRGDGWFGQCADGSQNCACSGMQAASFPVPTADLAFAHLHDVTGDGLADLIIPSDTGFTAYQNIGGAFDTGIPVNVVSSFGWAHANTPPGSTTYAFADLEGSGVDGVILVNNAVNSAAPSNLPAPIGYVNPNARGRAGTGIRPGLLTTIADGYDNVTTSITYSQLASPGTPQVLFVVTGIDASDNASAVTLVPDKVTTYAYSSPRYDSREHQFIGFQSVDTYTTGDAASDPPVHVGTTFYQAYCTGGSSAQPCPTTTDDPMHSMRGLAVLSTVDNATATQAATVTLSSTHHGYTVTPTYTGLDGRNVYRVWESQTDRYIFDTSNPSPPSSPVALTDVILNGTPLASQSSVLVATTAVHEMQVYTVDPFGLSQSTDDYGAVDASGNSIDGVIRTTETYAPAKQDTVDFWIWRPYDELTVGVVGGSPTGVAREVTYDYDPRGNVLHAYSPLTGTLPLARSHETGAFVAGPPPVHSSDGTVTLSTFTYTPDLTGNVMRVEQPGTSGCVDYAYDAQYARVTTSTKVYLEGCGGNYTATMLAKYDRGLGVVEDETTADGQRTVVTYDAFGRPLTVQRPDPTTPGGVEAQPSITMDYRDVEVPRKTHTSIVDGTATREYWQYLDGFGQPILSLSPADPASNDPSSWIINGAFQRSAKGHVLTAYTPSFYTSGTDPDKVPLPVTGPSRTFRYDAFGRPVGASDIDGTALYARSYTALGYVVRDAQQILSGNSTTKKFDSHGRLTTMVRTGQPQLSETYTHLPTGELSSLQRTGTAANGTTSSYQRWMQYDSLGRMVLNVEPNTTLNFVAAPPAPANMKAWTYAYDDAGRLVGTADARGCGENIAYDGAGRVAYEDYSPCLASQVPYTAPAASGALGKEAYYVYDDAGLTGMAMGRRTDVYDRGQHSHYAYDARGRIRTLSRQIAEPGQSVSVDYASPTYVKAMQYDSLDRLTQESTGSTVVALQSFGIAQPGGPSYGAGVVAGSYSPRGTLSYISGAYGDLLTGVQQEADGRPDAMQYADNASTAIKYSYNDPRNRVTETKVSRAAGFASSQATAAFTAQTVLADDVVGSYDPVSNPLSIADQRIASEWPADSEPVSRAFVYDDQYSLTQTTNTFGAPGTYSSPIADATPQSSPVPMSTISGRVAVQTFAYDGTGNSLLSTDNNEVFFDRSLGTIVNGNAPATAPGPDQLASAAVTFSHTGNTGSLSATYDPSGNLVQLAVERDGTCTGSAGCSQLFRYDWDELGQLAHARRYDLDATGPASYVYPNLPTTPPNANVVYTYDSAGRRVIRGPGDASAAERYSVEIFDSLRLNEASWNDTAYEDTVDTEGVYLTFGSMSLGRVVGDLPPDLSPSNDSTHVFLELSDSLGSTSSVIDVESGELVEKTTYQAYGAVESDYRPERWQRFREAYKFTGKEDDVEMGITYFGARYYSPFLGRWMSPDPLAIHSLGGDLNPYAYVHGRVTTAVDALGLDDDDDDGGMVQTDEDNGWGDCDKNSTCTDSENIGSDGSVALVRMVVPRQQSPQPPPQKNDANTAVDVASTMIRGAVSARVQASPALSYMRSQGQYWAQHPAEYWQGFKDKLELTFKVASVVSMLSAGSGPPATSLPALATSAAGASAAGAAIRAAIPLVPLALLAAAKGGGPPNPYGKAGGPAHQAKVNEIVQDIESRGLTAQQEYKVNTPGGEKGARFVDVVGRDANGNVVEMHQAGRQTLGGSPVAREVRAMDDIEAATGMRPTFHPYN